MNGNARSAAISRFIADASAWVALLGLAGDIFRMLLDIKGEYPPVVGGLAGVLLATGLALLKWRPLRTSFAELRNYLLETDIMFLSGIIGQREYERLRQNRIRHFR
jgi:hypothetical protein